MKTVINQEKILRDLGIANTSDSSKIDIAISPKAVEGSVNTLSSSINEEASIISCFNNIKDPRVLGEIDIYDFLESVRSPNPLTKRLINKAREHKSIGQEDEYTNIKEKLSCFTLNFSFQARKSNAAIKAPTGLIYIDIDNELDLDLTNNLVFASWKSLSGLGRGVLVKVDGLTLDNFKSTYLDIAISINTIADKQAAKATQYTIHSYDEDIYINEDSTTWYAKEGVKNTPTTLIYKKGRKDVRVLGEKYELRYDNIADLDFGDKDYLFFPDEKEMIAVAYIPSVIRVGARNQVLSAHAHQIRALNRDQSEEGFTRYTMNVNRSRCTEPLKEKEILGIVSKILKQDNLEPIYNKARRIIFNPKSSLSKNEKQKITNKHLGMLKSEKTKADIKECLLSWDKCKFGKVTQKTLALVAKKNIKTIEKYYKGFIELRDRINKGVSKT